MERNNMEPVTDLSPTYANQLREARKILEADGPEALRNPHALTGSICGCKSCFCCAAFTVYYQAKGKRPCNK
jgi:hypothetical protein